MITGQIIGPVWKRVRPILRNLRALSLAIGAFAMLATATQAQVTPGKVTVVMPASAETYMIPFFVAEDAGFYKNAGVTVDIKTVSGNQNALRAIITGAGDVAVVGYPILYEAVVNGAKLKGIGGGNQALVDYFLVLAKAKGSTLKDAAGKVLAISTPGSMPQLIPELMFKEMKIDSAGTRFVPVGSISVRLQSVLAGKVDGTLLDLINTLRGERTGEIAVVGNAAQILPEALGYTMSVTTDDALKDPARRADLYKFVKATMQGARLASEKPDVAAAAMHKRLGGSVEMDLLKEVATRLNADRVWGLNGGFSRKMHDYTMKTYLQYKLVSKEVSYESSFDQSLIDQAVKELGEVKDHH